MLEKRFLRANSPENPLSSNLSVPASPQNPWPIPLSILPVETNFWLITHLQVDHTTVYTPGSLEVGWFDFWNMSHFIRFSYSSQSSMFFSSRHVYFCGSSRVPSLLTYWHWIKNWNIYLSYHQWREQQSLEVSKTGNSVWLEKRSLGWQLKIGEKEREMVLWKFQSCDSKQFEANRTFDRTTWNVIFGEKFPLWTTEKQKGPFHW